MPWITLPPSNILMLLATAQTKLPIKNTIFATSSTGFRPHISLNLPHVGVDAAAARRYDEPIQV